MLGRLRLAALIRYVPFPVVGGFLAGIGWLLLQGSFSVLCDQSLKFANLETLASLDTAVKWIPGVVFCAALVALQRRYDHYLILPGLLVGSCFLFFIVVPLSGHTYAQVMVNGWMLGPYAEEVLWDPLRLTNLGDVRWSVLATQWPGMATLVIVGTMDLLLNASGVELSTRQDYDMDREMRNAGITNVVSGLLGGQSGWHAGTTTVLAYKIAGPTRMAGVSCGILCGLVLLLGVSVVEYLPRWVLGGLLMFLGIEFLRAWVIDGWRRLPRSDYVIVILILATIGAVGFLEGIALGLAAAIAMFVVNYSRAEVIKHSMSAAILSSNVHRSEHDANLLRQHGEKILALKLQGYLFFGTANKLLTYIAERAQASDTSDLRFIVLDFQLVTGIDSSAATSFMKLKQFSEQAGFFIVMSSLEPGLERQLGNVLVPSQDEERIEVYPDLDHGLEHCEEALLAELSEGRDYREESLQAFLEEHFDAGDVSRLFDKYFDCRAVKKGTFLIHQDSEPDALFFIESGRATVVYENPDGSLTRLRKLNHGAAIGEIGYYLGELRTASVVVDDTSVVYQLSAHSLQRMEREDPPLAFGFHRFIIELLSLRLVHNSRTLSVLMRQ